MRSWTISHIYIIVVYDEYYCIIEFYINLE